MNRVLSWLGSALFGCAIAILVQIFLFVPTRVAGHSMSPTLRDTEYVVVAKWPHVFREVPNYGDIVIIDSRVNRNRTIIDDITEPVTNFYHAINHIDTHTVWVKRVIGKAGDTIEIKEGMVYRNGEPLQEKYIPEKMNDPYKAYTVPDGMVFVMGDNRNHSGDSRIIGSVPLNHVLGKVAIAL